MPFDDWQFWVVTVLGFVALYVVLRPFLRTRRGTGSCSSCGSGARPRSRGARVKLTVEQGGK